MVDKKVKNKKTAKKKIRELTEEEKLIKYVHKSTYRQRTLKAIGNDVKMPREIARDSGILPNHISNVLGQLKDKHLVECLNPAVRKGRLYRLSDEGRNILNKIE